jgi:hypothetical protein
MPAHTHTIDQTAEMAAGPYTGSLRSGGGWINSGSAGGNVGHNHPLYPDNLNMAVSYIDVTLASKD